MKSYWLESIEKNKFDKLIENENVDVCIIGGGITGITTAYYLSKTNLKVVLLERDSLCEKTTGNSTAKITSQHGLFYDYLIQSQGKEKAKQYLDANEQAIKNIENIIKDEKIDCNFEKQDAYVFARRKEEIEKIKKEVEAVNSLGFEAEFVNNLELPFETFGAIKFKNQAQFNPCKYVDGLINVIKNKVDIYENTKVVNLKEVNGKYEVITDEGNKITTKHVVMATHYPIINAPGYYFLKMYQSMSYVIGAEVEGKIFDGMYISSDSPSLSFRTAKEEDKQLLIIVGRDHKTGKKIDLDGSYEALERMAEKLYPGCKVKYKWCTEDCISLDKIPYIGEFSKMMPNVYVATGFKKWGITSSNVAANIIVDKIIGKENSYQEVFASTRLEPVKNYKEMGNMIKESVSGLITEKIKLPNEKLEDIGKEEGGVIELDGKKLGVYRSKNNKVYVVKPVCTHLGCELSWNSEEKTWDCPCHGSRFSYDGKSLYTPSIQDLQGFEVDL